MGRVLGHPELRKFHQRYLRLENRDTVLGVTDSRIMNGMFDLVGQVPDSLFSFTNPIVLDANQKSPTTDGIVTMKHLYIIYQGKLWL